MDHLKTVKTTLETTYIRKDIGKRKIINKRYLYQLFVLVPLKAGGNLGYPGQDPHYHVDHIAGPSELAKEANDGNEDGIDHHLLGGEAVGIYKRPEDKPVAKSNGCRNHPGHNGEE